MDSFSVWIKVSSKKLSPNSSQFGVEYHLNLWHLRKGDPFIDIGLMIPLNEGLEQLAIDLPLSITKDDIQDLHDKLMEKKVGPLVFNTNCTDRTFVP